MGKEEEEEEEEGFNGKGMFRRSLNQFRDLFRRNSGLPSKLARHFQFRPGGREASSRLLSFRPPNHYSYLKAEKRRVGWAQLAPGRKRKGAQYSRLYRIRREHFGITKTAPVDLSLFETFKFQLAKSLCPCSAACDRPTCCTILRSK